jgi:hypothetical protein
VTCVTVLEFLVQGRLLLLVAVEAPLHGEWFFFCHERHSGHVPVTALTRNTRPDVRGVMEVHVIGHVVHSVPAKRFLVKITVPHRGQEFRVLQDFLMTAITRFHRRHSGI